MTLADAKRERIEAFLSEWMDTEGCPGTSVAIVTGDDVTAFGLGSRDIAANDPATADTLYGIASCTKSFTTTAIMQLAEAGELDVYDPVSEHLPFDIWADADPPVTIHDLMTHSSGIPGDGSTYLLLARQLGLTDRTVPLGSRDDLRRFVDASLPRRTDGPGEAFYYHNAGYTLLGEVVAHHADTPYHEYVNEAILEPLDMRRSTFLEAEVTDDPDTLTPYLLTEDGPEAGHFPFEELTYPAGGLLSSVSELSNYLRMNLNGGTFDGERVLSEASIAAMREGYITWDYAMSASDNEYGYGWTVKQFMGEDVYSHIGDIAVSSAYLGFSPTADIGVAVLANVSPEYILQSVGEAVLSILLDGDPKADVPFWSVREKFSRLTGGYESYSGVLSGTIVRDGQTLQFEPDGALPITFQLIPETTARHEYDFYTISEEGHKKPLRVDVDEDGVDVFLGRWRLHKVEETVP